MWRNIETSICILKMYILVDREVCRLDVYLGLSSDTRLYDSNYLTMYGEIFFLSDPRKGKMFTLYNVCAAHCWFCGAQGDVQDIGGIS